MELSDVLLLERIAAGDAEAFGIFYDRHSATVFGHLCRLIPQREGAEDVLQEAFCYVWRKAANFDLTRGSVRAWLFLLARSRAWDYLRKQRPSDSLDAAVNLPAPTVRDPLELKDLSLQLAGALADIPEEQRQALGLAFFDGLTQEQVAAAQGVPLGTAKTRIRRAMNRLRAELGQSQEGQE